MASSKSSKSSKSPKLSKSTSSSNPLKSIQAAIRRGEKALQKKKEEEAKLALEKEEKSRIAARKYAAEDDVWVRDELPGIIEAETAKGQRRFYLGYNKSRADACERAGLKVDGEYVEETCDEGAVFGGGWAYDVTW